MVNQVLLVGTISSVPRFFVAAKDTAEVEKLLFDVDTGDSHVHHCQLYEETAWRGHNEDGLEIGDLIFVRGRLEGHRMLSNDLDDLGEWVYVAVEGYRLLTEWARRKTQPIPPTS